ncbi:hypothetical protein D1AOALGA4SA_3958 [Olavius algarvensis Delta 1 endosymbiont]|nr:hypothetical protein D1AOALGA4SA_3958 [Olavius algarvensis Delta 1 endosymbiont]
MFLWPRRFVLDPRPCLLLKLRDNSKIVFYLTKMNAIQWLHCKYASGAGGVFRSNNGFCVIALTIESP